MGRAAPPILECGDLSPLCRSPLPPADHSSVLSPTPYHLSKNNILLQRNKNIVKRYQSQVLYPDSKTISPRIPPVPSASFSPSRTFSESLLFGSVSANCHAAPSSSVSPCLIKEKEDAVLPGACLDVPKVRRGNEPGNFFSDGCEHRFRLTPSASCMEMKIAGGYVLRRPL
jgi:hypothetical protein